MRVLRFPAGLYGITPEWDDTARLIAAVKTAAAGGMAALQWRRKTISTDQRLAQARALAQCCSESGLLFIVNDDWRLALQVDADGVHLGREDGALSEARAAMGPDKIIGCSCYNDPALAQAALLAGADYVAFGAVYASTVKPGAGQATLDTISQGRRLTEQAVHPSTGRRAAVVAIGGITADNAEPVIAAGADSVAVINGLFGSNDVFGTATQFKSMFGSCVSHKDEHT